MAAIEPGRRYYAVPMHRTRTLNSDTRPVYALLCGEEGPRRIGVPQHVSTQHDGERRLLYVAAGCLDGQPLDGWHVVAIPQHAIHNGRQVMAFVCCSEGSRLFFGSSSRSSSSESSSSSSNSSSSSSSGSSSSGSSSSSSSSSSSNSGVSSLCCPAGVNLPTTLYLTVSGSGACEVDGTYTLGFPFGSSGWHGTTSGGCPISFTCLSQTTPLSSGFQLTVYPGLFGACSPCYQVLGGGNSSGTWESSSCSPPNWTSNPTDPLAGACSCAGGGATFTVTG